MTFSPLMLIQLSHIYKVVVASQVFDWDDDFLDCVLFNGESTFCISGNLLTLLLKLYLAIMFVGKYQLILLKQFRK